VRLWRTGSVSDRSGPVCIDFVEQWIFAKLFLYSLQHPSVINHISQKARVFVPGRKKVTNPEPDVACYCDFPKHIPFDEIRWQDISPMLVIEILSENDPDKDLVRNVKLYRKVPSIQEYWIVDTRRSASRPTLLVHRRNGRRWQKLEVGPGETYMTKLLPGLALIVDPLV